MTDLLSSPRRSLRRGWLSLSRHVRHYATAYLILLVGLTLTLVGSWGYVHDTRARDQRAFDQIAAELQQSVAFRMEAYVSALTQTRGLFAVSRDVSPAVFREYVQASGILAIYPGVQGIGYTRKVKAHELDSHLRGMREQGFQEHRDRPGGPRSEHFSIIMLEPLDWRNKRAIGYDMSTEPVRGQAMDEARDSGSAQLSGKVSLVQETDVDRQPGFLIYVPVYAENIPHETVEERRAALEGFVYSPFRAYDLFESIFASIATILREVNLSVYDGPATHDDALLFRHESHPGKRRGFEKTLRMDIAGRPWTIRIEATPRFGGAGADASPALGLLLGTALSSLLFIFLKVAKDQSSRLAKADRRFRSLFETNVIGCYVKALDGRILEANDAFLDSIGRSRADLEQGLLRWDAITPPEWNPQDEAIVRQFKESGRFGPCEKEYVHADGRRVPVLIGGAGHAHDASVLTFALDLTRLKESERNEQAARKEAERLYHEAKRSSRLKDDFLATVSHELRTPLNVIIGHSEMLLRNKTQPDLIPYSLQAIHRNAKAQAQIIEDLLDVSRILSGKLQLQVESVSAAKIVAEAMGTVKLAAEAKGIQIRVRDGSSDALVSGDPIKLQQVVWNLLSNAIKFSQADTYVDVAIDADEASTEISVQDYGEGIDSSFMPHVFDRFRQEDSSRSRRHGGLGLGLSIAHHIVEAHGGTLRVHSAGKGKGACFTVRLPRRPSIPPRQTARRDAAPYQQPRDDFEDLTDVKVLVVEDQEDTRMLLKVMLEHFGAEVVTASSASEALRTLGDFEPTVILSDISMPDMDGYELIRQLRARGLTIPAAALTAHARREEHLDALAAGFDLHVNKPVESEDLITTMRRLIALSRSR